MFARLESKQQFHAALFATLFGDAASGLDRPMLLCRELNACESHLSTMAAPKISICLPNLNHRRFLPARIDSIYAQTFQDWELIVVDSHSDDGSWEYMQERFAGDRRVKMFQTPRDGLYRNWNRCVEHSSGEYVYFATSDDTFYPQCLERACTALEQHPKIDLCDFNIHMLDEQGKVLENKWDNMFNVKVFDGWMHRDHTRSGAADLLMMPCIGTIIVSMTGVLIRRSLFEKTGLFPTEYGPIGDYAWQMMAFTHTDVVHLADYLATWRTYEGQLTQHDTLSNLKRTAKVCSDYASRFDPAFRDSCRQLQVNILRHECRNFPRFKRKVLKSPQLALWFWLEKRQGRNPWFTKAWMDQRFKRDDFRPLSSSKV